MTAAKRHRSAAYVRQKLQNTLNETWSQYRHKAFGLNSFREWLQEGRRQLESGDKLLVNQPSNIVSCSV
jgi:hypothetical protein